MLAGAKRIGGEIVGHVMAFSSAAEAEAEEAAQRKRLTDLIETVAEAILTELGVRLDTPGDVMQFARRAAAAVREGMTEDGDEKLHLLAAAALGVQLVANADDEERGALWQTARALRPGDVRALMATGGRVLTARGVVGHEIASDVLAALQRGGAYERLQAFGCVRILETARSGENARGTIKMRSGDGKLPMERSVDLLPFGERVLEVFVPFLLTVAAQRDRAPR